MNKNDIIFLVVCVVVVVAILGVYRSHQLAYETMSAMEVVPVENISSAYAENTDITTTNTTATREYVISKETTATTTVEYTSTTATANTTTPTVTSTVTKTTTTSKGSTTTTTHTTTAKTTTTKSTTTTQTETSVNFPISLNAITHDELVCIKGIGDVTASKIIAYREQIGYFVSRYQLLDIDGIGESKMNTIMEYTYIENEDLNYGQVVEVEPMDYVALENQQEYNFAQMGNASTNATTPLTTTTQATSPKQTTQATTITIPTETTTQCTTTTTNFPIDLNTATFDELCTIPNVNQELAQKILDLRNTIGIFSNVYELLYVDGISESFLSELSQYVTIN